MECEISPSINSCTQGSEIQIRGWAQLKIETTDVGEIFPREAIKWKGGSLGWKHETQWADTSEWRPLQDAKKQQEPGVWAAQGQRLSVKDQPRGGC